VGLITRKRVTAVGIVVKRHYNAAVQMLKELVAEPFHGCDSRWLCPALKRADQPSIGEDAVRIEAVPLLFQSERNFTAASMTKLQQNTSGPRKDLAGRLD